MNSSKTINDWSTVKSIASSGYQHAVEPMALVCIIERSNRPTVIRGLNNDGAGRAVKLLINAVISRLVLFATRDVLPVRSGDLTFGAVERFLKTYDYSKDAYEDDVRLALKLFDEYRQAPATKSLIHFRNKNVAHIAAPQEEPPIYNDLFDCVNLAAQYWEKLANGVGAFTMPISYQVEAYVECSEKLWSRWE